MDEVSFTDELTVGFVKSLWEYRQTLAELWPRACPRSELKLHLYFSHVLWIVYQTFRPSATTIYILQPNEEHHWNREKILNHTKEEGLFKKKNSSFVCIRPLLKLFLIVPMRTAAMRKLNNKDNHVAIFICNSESLERMHAMMKRITGTRTIT